MDPLIVFVCIFLPTFVLNLLSAGRDQILFETRPKTRRWVVLLLMAAAMMALLAARTAAAVGPGPRAAGTVGLRSR